MRASVKLTESVRMRVISEFVKPTDLADYELPVTEHWRERMLAARKAKGWTQTELANAIGFGCDQTNVSDVERGHVATSAWVGPISRALGIPLSVDAIDAEQLAEWFRVGRDALRHDPEFFAKYLDLIRADVERHSKK